MDVDADRLRAAVGDRWARIEVVAQTASTNLDLLGAANAPDRSVRVADHQTAGRGRLDRRWVSPPGTGLTFSVLLRPTAPLLTWSWLPLLTGVAVRDGVTASTGVATALKWPNDLLDAATGRKIAGILAQTGDGCVVIGVGLNVTTAEADLPVPTATSLALAGASDLDRTAVLVAVLTALDARYAQWSDCAGDAEACGLAAAYAQACMTLGRRVRVARTDSTVIEGVAVRVDGGGRLHVDVDGREETVAAGDVEHAGPA